MPVSHCCCCCCCCCCCFSWLRHLCTGFQYDDETDELRQNNDGEDVEEEEEGEELFGDEMERLVLSTWQRQHTNDGLPERDCPYFERHALIHHPTINPQHQPLEKLNTKRCPSPPPFFFLSLFLFCLQGLPCHSSPRRLRPQHAG